MELSHIQKKILDLFVNQTIKCLDNTAGLHATAGTGFEDSPDKFNFNGYAVAADTSGMINGKIMMHLTNDTALLIGNKFREAVLGDSNHATEMNEDVSESLEEFANTTIGLTTRALEQADLGISFKPPYFIADKAKMGEVLNDVQEIICVPIELNGGVFNFSYLLHEHTEG